MSPQLCGLSHFLLITGCYTHRLSAGDKFDSHSYLRSRFRELADGVHPSQFPVTIFADKHRRNTDVVMAGFALEEETDARLTPAEKTNTTACSGPVYCSFIYSAH